MKDQEFLDHAEHVVRAHFYPPFDDNHFFNDTLFHYLLHEADHEPARLDEEARRMTRHIGDDTHHIKLRINRDKAVINFKFYTPSECRKVIVSENHIEAREMGAYE